MKRIAAVFTIGLLLLSVFSPVVLANPRHHRPAPGYHNHHPHYQPPPPSITTYTITLAETQYADVVHSNGFACRYYGPWTVGDIIQYNIVTLNPIVLGPTQYADFVFANGASQRFHGPGVFNLVLQYTLYEDEE